MTEGPGPLFPGLPGADHGEAIRFPEGSLTYGVLHAATSHLAGQLEAGERVAVWAVPRLETCVGVVGALLAGSTVVPLNPKLGPRELQHVLAGAGPDKLIAASGEHPPDALATLPRVHVDLDAVGSAVEEPDDPELPAFVFYTSGTTGPPKGAVLPRRAVASNLDALAEVWEWTERDVLVHGLPLFHVHRLVLGCGPACRRPHQDGGLQGGSR